METSATSGTRHSGIILDALSESCDGWRPLLLTRASLDHDKERLSESCDGWRPLLQICYTLFMDVDVELSESCDGWRPLLLPPALCS